MADNNPKIVISAVDQTGAAFKSVIGGLKDVGAASDKLKSIAENLPLIGSTLAGALSGAAISTLVKSSIDAADAMNDMSQRIGINIKDLGAWKLAAESSGASMESIAKGVKGLSGFMVENSAKLKEAGITATDANGAMTQLADLFQAMPDGIEKTALATKLFGKAGMDLIPMLNMGSAGLQEAQAKAAEYARRLEELAPLADKFNDHLTELSLQSQAAGMNISTYFMPGLIGIVSALNDLKAGGDRAKNALEIFSEASPFFRGLVKVHDMLARIGALNGVGGDTSKNSASGSIGRRAMSLQDEIALGEKNEKAIDAQRRAQGLLDKETVEGLSEMDTAYNRIVDAANKYRTELNAQLEKGAALTAGEKLLAEAKDVLTDKLYKELEAYLKNNIAKEKSVTIALQAAKAEDELQKARIKKLEEGYREIDALDAEIAKQIEHNAEIGLTAAQLAAQRDARDADTIAMLNQQLEQEKLTGLGAAEIAVIEEKIKSMEKLRGLRAEGAAKAAAFEEVKAQAEGWKSIESVAHAAWGNIEKDGIGSLKRLGDTLKSAIWDMLYQMAVKKWIVDISASVSGSSVAGQAFGAATGGAGGSQMFGLASQGSSLYNFATGNVGGGAYGAFAGSSVGQGLGLSTELAGPTLTGAPLTGLTSLGTAIPYIGAAIAAISVLTSLMGKGGGPKTEGGWGGQISDSGSLYNASSAGNFGQAYTGHSADATVAQIVTPLGPAVANLIKGLGGNSSGIGIQLGYNTDPAGTAPDNILGRVKSAAGQTVYSSVYDTTRGGAGDALKVEAERITLASVKAATGIDSLFTNIVAGIDIATASSTELEAALTKLTTVAVIRKEFETLGWDVSKLTTTLIDAAGGAANLQAGLSSYYDNFYSEAEKQSATWASLTDQFSAIGIALPDATVATREWFRAQMEMPGITEATRAALLGLSGAFASVVSATTLASAAVVDSAAAIKAAADLKRTNDNLLVTQYELEGKAADALALRRALETDGMAESTLAIQNRIYALQDEAAAAQAAAVVSEKRLSWQNQLDVLTGAKTQTQIDRANLLASTTDSTTISLMNQVFAQQDLASAAETQKQAVSSFWGSVAQSFDASYKAQEAALKSTITQMDGFTASLQKFQNTLGSGSLSGGSIFDQYASANQQFVATSQAASFGNTDAIAELPSIIQTFLAASKAIATDATAYALDVGRASNSLGSAMNYTSGMSAQAQSSLTGLPAAQNAAMQAFAAAVRKTMPGYASGGNFGGGVRLVGENGPEIEFTGPSRITSNADSKKLLDLSPLLAELSALRSEVTAQRYTLGAIAQGTNKTADTLDSCTGGGGPMLVQTA